jgi:hypothetical protein
MFMLHRYSMFLFLGILAVVSMTAIPVFAEIIPIANADFESPVIDSATHIYGQIYEQSEFYMLEPWMVWQGALTNPTILDAALPGSGFGIDMTGHGNQVAYMYCGDPSAGNRPYWYQTLTTTFEEGVDYTLSLQAAVTTSGVANAGQTLEMSLGYWNGQAAGDGPTIVARRLIGSTEISSTWGDYSTNSGAVSGDAVGKPIVVFISQGNDPYVQGPQYYFDNVQLVPEPGTIALLATGFCGVAIYVGRKRS